MRSELILIGRTVRRPICTFLTGALLRGRTNHRPTTYASPSSTIALTIRICSLTGHVNERARPRKGRTPFEQSSSLLSAPPPAAVISVAPVTPIIVLCLHGGSCHGLGLLYRHIAHWEGRSGRHTDKANSGDNQSRNQDFPHAFLSSFAASGERYRDSAGRAARSSVILVAISLIR